MLSSRIPSVKDTYFQHKVLTRIHGQPVYESLHTMQTELKANASSVPTTLGAGQYGHLGLLLSAVTYAALPDTVPWVSPVNPGPFIPPPVGTGPQIEAAKDVWRESKQTYEICQATEKALIAQIVESIDPIYLRALLNRATGQYSTSIRVLMLHLFTTYGKITPQQVKGREMELYNLHFDISQPVDNVFNSIADLAELADHANSPMTMRQMIDLAYVILAKQPILQQDLRLWNRRPVAEHTWSNMMSHFRDAQTDLRSLPTAADIYHQQPPHQANQVTEIVDLVAQRLLDALVVPAPAIPPPTLPSSDSELANSLQRRETDLQTRESAMLTQMQDMMSSMLRANNQHTPRASTRHSSTTTSTTTPAGRQSQGRGRPGRSTSTPRAPRAYCWSHGACAHDSPACNRPSPHLRVEI